MMDIKTQPKKQYSYKRKIDVFGNPTIKNATGTPARYATPQDMQDRIDEYFANCPDRRTMYFKLKDEVLEKDVPNYTINGLTLFLGYSTKQSFYELCKNPQFSFVVKRARLRIENEYEKLLKDNSVGAIFALKNMGWIDRQDLRVDIEENIHVDLSMLSDADLMKELAKLEQDPKLIEHTKGARCGDTKED